MRPNGGSEILSVGLSIHLKNSFYPLLIVYPTWRIGWGTSVVGIERQKKIVSRSSKVRPLVMFHRLSRSSVGSSFKAIISV